ncbi:MAG: TetR family transcriptional regulator, partial [Ignavibacteria bacterium]
MRHKDAQKQQAIIRATIKLVNEIGFDSASVSKIAR